MDDWTYVTLRCINCEKTLCGIARCIVDFDSKEGCTRQVDEATAAQYFHYIEEVIPFWKNYNSDYVTKSYKEIMDFLYNKIYSAPVGRKLDYNGKTK